MRPVVRFLLLFVCVASTATAGVPIEHARRGAYAILENETAFLAVAASQRGDGAFTFGCSKRAGVCGHLVRFPQSDDRGESLDRIAIAVDTLAAVSARASALDPGTGVGSTRIVAAMVEPMAHRLAAGRVVTFWRRLPRAGEPGMRIPLDGYAQARTTVLRLSELHRRALLRDARIRRSAFVQATAAPPGQRALRDALRRRDAQMR